MKTVKVNIITQGTAVCGDEGYMLVHGGDVAAFYLDGWGATGRIYPAGTSQHEGCPSIYLDDGQGEATAICFPEFHGWNVHCVSGGKTMAVCLTKETK